MQKLRAKALRNSAFFGVAFWVALAASRACQGILQLRRCVIGSRDPIQGIRTRGQG